MKSWPLVSVLTPTYNRRAFLGQYLKYVRTQDYGGPIEVLIADDGDDPVGDLFQSDARIRYIRLAERTPLGYKRNLLAREARGEMLVHMDDDDYYPPNRISSAVDALLESDRLIAASSQMYIYNVISEQIVVSGPFGPSHGTANTFAYRRAYLTDHSFPEAAWAQEEPGFTENFSVPMIQLDSRSTVLQIQHQRNTWDKNNTLVRPTNFKLKDFVRDINDRRFYRSRLAKLLESESTGV